MRKLDAVPQSSNALRLLLFIIVWGLNIGGKPLDARTPRFVCRPCGLPCDAKFFDSPGKCPSCGMPLVTEGEATAILAAIGPQRKVAILIFDGVEIIDFTGPYEVFGAADFQVYTVAKTKDPVTTSMGMTVVPRYAFEDAPQPDVLLVPGGGVKAAGDDAVTIGWIKDQTLRAKHTMSVCNGAFILAHAGLLEGLSATTTSGNIARLRDEFPGITVVSDQRFVDNGKIITTAGLSAGIDGALHVVSTMMGEGAAERVALGLEYDWHPRTPFVRAALADNLIPIQNLPEEAGRWEVKSTRGGTGRWELILSGTSQKSVPELRDYFEKMCEQKGQWHRIQSRADGSSEWEFNSPDGKPWRGSLTVHKAPGKQKEYLMKIEIAKR